MDIEQKSRIIDLADYIKSTHSPLIFTMHLKLVGKMGYGYSMLGLICEAHRAFTKEGNWARDQEYPDIPLYLTKDGAKSDRYLPKLVMEYFGFSSDTCLFDVADLSNKTTKLMYKLKDKTEYSLYALGLEYITRHNKAQQIAFEILNEFPKSLFVPIDNDEN